MSYLKLMLGRGSYVDSVMEPHRAPADLYKGVLDVEERAMGAAVEDQGVTALLQEVDQSYRKNVNSMDQDVARELNTHAVERGQLRNRMDPERMEMEVASAREELVRLKVDSRDALLAAYVVLRRAKKMLRRFKKKEGVQRDPIVPLPFWILVLTSVTAVVIEGLINALSFAEVLSGGLLAGLMQAMLLAAINVSTAMGAGAIARSMLVPRIVRRIFAGVSTVLYFLFLTGFTGLVAHYRVALHVNPGNAASEAVMRLVNTPLAVYDFSAVVLAITCVIAAIVAFAAAFRAKDPFTEFAEIAGEASAAEESVKLRRQEYLSNVDRVTEDPIARIEDCEMDAANARERFDENMVETMGLKTACHSELANHDISRKNAWNAVCASYRSVLPSASLPDLPPQRLMIRVDFDTVVDTTFEQDQTFAKRLSEHMKDHGKAADRYRLEIGELRREAWENAETYFTSIEAAAERAEAQRCADDGIVVLPSEAPSAQIPFIPSQEARGEDRRSA